MRCGAEVAGTLADISPAAIRALLRAQLDQVRSWDGFLRQRVASWMPKRWCRRTREARSRRCHRPYACTATRHHSITRLEDGAGVVRLHLREGQARRFQDRDLPAARPAGSIRHRACAASAGAGRHRGRGDAGPATKRGRRRGWQDGNRGRRGGHGGGAAAGAERPARAFAAVRASPGGNAAESARCSPLNGRPPPLPCRRGTAAATQPSAGTRPWCAPDRRGSAPAPGRR